MGLNFEKDIILENHKTRIEPLGLSHFDYLKPIVLATPDILKYSPPKFGTTELLLQYIEHNIALRNAELKYPFAIFDKSKNTFAGSTSFMNISIENKRIEIGSTWIGKEFQKTGLNHHCKYLMMQYVFEVLFFERIEFKTDKRNKQSQKAIQRIGGQFEGTLRSHTLMSDGFRRDTMCYSILKDEWINIKKSIFNDIQI